MTDIVISPITSGYNVSRINNNFNKIRDSINGDLLNLAGGNNVMGQSIDMNSNRIFNMADAVAMLDAVNLRQMLNTLELWSQGGKDGVPGMSVNPQVFTWTGDGTTTDIPIPGADINDSSFYDTAQDGLVLEPERDFTIVMPSDDVNDTILRLTVPTPNGVQGFTVLRGYARPYAGDAPITTINSTIVNISGSGGESTSINGTLKNTLIVVDSAFDTFITIAANTGSETSDWKIGDFFSILQLGDGKVEMKIEAGGSILPSPGFTTITRGKGSITSATNYDATTNKWAASGDLEQEVVNSLPESMMLVVSDESTALTTGTGKFKMRMPYGLILTDLRASLSTAQASGSVFTVDLMKNGTSILSTKLTIDNTKFSSHASVNQPVFTNNVVADDDELRIDITQVGTSGATGLKVYLLGLRA